MEREKRRPTLEELKEGPVDLWRLEAAQISVEASEAGREDVVTLADELIHDPEITPEKVVELRELLRRGTGSSAIASEREAA